MTERVVIVEDHAMVIDGLRAVMELDSRIELVGSASTLAEFGQRLPAWDPTVVVADYQLPDGTGTDVPAMLAAAGVEAPVVIMSGLETARVLDDAIRAGCGGYVSKALRSTELVDALTAVARGATVFPEESLGPASTDLTRPGATLTSRELEVLQSLADARSSDEISVDLDISVHTVRNHVKAILSKLHARSQLEAVVTAVRHGLVSIRPSRP